MKAQSRLLTPDQHMAPSECKAHSLPGEPALSASENMVKDYLLIEKKSETVEQYIWGEMFINHEHNGEVRQPEENSFTKIIKCFFTHKWRVEWCCQCLYFDK